MLNLCLDDYTLHVKAIHESSILKAKKNIKRKRKRKEDD